MTLPAIYDLDEEYENALNRDADKESRLFSISHLDFMHPLDELVLDENEDTDIRIAALDCLGIFKNTIYEIDIDKVPKELALAIIEKYDFNHPLNQIALNHKDVDYRLKALENRFMDDEDVLKNIIENESNSKLRSAAAKHKSLNDREFLERIALNDEDKYVRSAAASNYSTQNIEVLTKIIEEDKEDIVRISALKNLIFKYNLYYPQSNKKYNFKRKFDKISRNMIRWEEDYIPNELHNDENIGIILDLDMLHSIFRSSLFEDYDKLRDNLIEYFERILVYFEKYNPFEEGKLEDESYNKTLYDKFKLQYGDIRRLSLYQLAYDGRIGDFKYYLDYLKSLKIDMDDFESSEESSTEKIIEESYFIELANNDPNLEIVRLALEGIRDNTVLNKFATKGQTVDIIKTAIKRMTDTTLLADMAINRIDLDIQEPKLYDDEWVCDYISEDVMEQGYSFYSYDFYSHDLKFYKRLFDNRLESVYYDAIAEVYYKDTLPYCIFKKIKNYFDLIFILKYTHSFALRDLIIYKISNPIILAYIALKATDERIRYAAFGRIESKVILKYVYLNSEDFRIKNLYLSKSYDNDALNEAFLKEENDVLRKSILDNPYFKIAPETMEYCIEKDSYISSYAENKFPKQFINYRLINKKFRK